MVAGHGVNVRVGISGVDGHKWVVRGGLSADVQAVRVQVGHGGAVEAVHDACLGDALGPVTEVVVHRDLVHLAGLRTEKEMMRRPL